MILYLRTMKFRSLCDVNKRVVILMMFEQSLMCLYEYDEGFVLYGCLWFNLKFWWSNWVLNMSNCSYFPCSHLRDVACGEVRSWWITCVGLRASRSVEQDYERGGS